MPKQMLMSTIMEKTKVTKVMEYYFHDTIQLCGIDGILDVITSLESECQFTLKVGCTIEVDSVSDENGTKHSLHMAFPLSMVKFSDVKIKAKDDDKLVKLTVKSCGLNELDFKWGLAEIILDDDTFKSKAYVNEGSCHSMGNLTPSCHSCVTEFKQCNILGHQLTIGTKCTCSSVLIQRDPASRAISALIQHDSDGFIFSDKKIYHMAYAQHTGADTYDVYYTLLRYSDILHKINTDHIKYPCYLITETENLITDAEINYPICREPCGITVKGNDLCPNIEHNKSICLVIKNIPEDELTMYRDLIIPIEYICLQPEHLRKLKEEADQRINSITAQFSL